MGPILTFGSEHSAFLLEKINMQSLIESTLLTMSSLEIAELCDKRHDHVMRDIKVMFEEIKKDTPNSGEISEIDTLNFEHIYEDKHGREQNCFELDKALTLTLVSGYNTVLRKKIIDRWLELETPTAQPVLNKPLHIPPLVEEFESALKLSRLVGFEGNEAILSANKAVRRNNGGSDLLEYVQAELVAPTKEHLFTPTQLGAMLDPQRKPADVNLLLMDMGLQTRIEVTSRGKTQRPYILAEKGKPLSKLIDAGKKHGGETSIQQIKWYKSVADMLQEHIEFEEE